MRTAKSVTKSEIKELLSKGWITHDAMWFYFCAMEFGMDTANRLNKKAVRAMARIEMQRVATILQIEKVTTYDQLQRIFFQGLELIKPEFMDFSISFPQNDLIVCEFGKCFAHEGMKRFGWEDKYDCGLFERFAGWFDTLSLSYTITPEIPGCMMHQQGKCRKEIHFAINPEDTQGV